MHKGHPELTDTAGAGNALTRRVGAGCENLRNDEGADRSREPPCHQGPAPPSSGRRAGLRLPVAPPSALSGKVLPGASELRAPRRQHGGSRASGSAQSPAPTSKSSPSSSAATFAGWRLMAPRVLSGAPGRRVAGAVRDLAPARGARAGGLEPGAGKRWGPGGEQAGAGERRAALAALRPRPPRAPDTPDRARARGLPEPEAGPGARLRGARPATLKCARPGREEALHRPANGRGTARLSLLEGGRPVALDCTQEGF